VNKKIALLVVRKNYREIDWIIPLIYKIKHKFKIITFFQNKNILRNFSKENVSLYKKWKKIDSFHFFPTTKHIFLSKLLTLFSFGNFFLKKLAKDYIRKKFYSEKYLNNILSKNNFYNCELKLIFHEIAKNTAWINTFLNHKNVKIIKFPDGTPPRGNYKIDKIKKKKIEYIKNLFIITSTKHDLPHYSSHYNLKNIRIIGYPRYENKWIKSFKKNKISNSRRIFLIGCKQYKPQHRESVKSQIFSIMNSTLLIKNSLTIFKPHPAQSISELKMFLSKFKASSWEISNNHILNYKNSAELFIGFHRSSSVLDALAANLPTIKLWSFKAWDKEDINEQQYLKRYNINNSILTELGLTKLVLNENDLKKMIKSSKTLKKKLLKKQKKNFAKLNIDNEKANEVLREIIK